MLTPEFKITQTQDHLSVVIRLPYVKVSACEFYIEQYNFKFYLKPYLLNLTFQQALQQAEQPAKATYYHEKHLLQVQLNKKNKGQHFENLSLLSKILNKGKDSKDKKANKVLIQVVDSPGLVNSEEALSKNAYGYGFCNNYSQIFQKLSEQCYEIFTLNPQQVSISDRSRLSSQICQSALDEDAYLFDKYENDEEIDRILLNEETALSIKNMMTKHNSKEPTSYEQFKSELKIPNKQILVPALEYPNIINQLFSICFSYLYELICMEGEISVESAKTINSSCSVLSCCVDYSGYGLPELIKDCSRRCISYSLYKNVRICQKVVQLLSLHLDQIFICAVLANLRNLFDKSDPRYLLNTIFINDYLIFCFQSKSHGQLDQIRKQLKNFQCSESFLDLEFQQQQEEYNSNGEKQDQKGQSKKTDYNEMLSRFERAKIHDE